MDHPPYRRLLGEQLLFSSLPSRILIERVAGPAPAIKPDVDEPETDEPWRAPEAPPERHSPPAPDRNPFRRPKINPGEEPRPKAKQFLPKKKKREVFTYTSPRRGVRVG